MGKKEAESSIETNIVTRFTAFLGHFDVAILVAVSIGIICLAAVVLVEGFSDLIAMTAHAPTLETDKAHSPTHVISDFMFVLIIMELMRQVMRQLQRQPFSLNPFLFIGVIASVRGILITMMGLAMGNIEWVGGVVRLGVYGVVVLILIFCYNLNSRTEKFNSPAS